MYLYLYNYYNNSDEITCKYVIIGKLLQKSPIYYLNYVSFFYLKAGGFFVLQSELVAACSLTDNIVVKYFWFRMLHFVRLKPVVGREFLIFI